MNADYSTDVIGHPEQMVYRFSIIGYLFGRELWRKTFFCGDEKRGVAYAEWYLKNRVANIACDRYRVEVSNQGNTRTVLGGRAPKNKDPWKADDAETLSSFPMDRILFLSLIHILLRERRPPRCRVDASDINRAAQPVRSIYSALQ